MVVDREGLLGVVAGQVDAEQRRLVAEPGDAFEAQAAVEERVVVRRGGRVLGGDAPDGVIDAVAGLDDIVDRVEVGQQFVDLGAAGLGIDGGIGCEGIERHQRRREALGSGHRQRQGVVPDLGGDGGVGGEVVGHPPAGLDAGVFGVVDAVDEREAPERGDGDDCDGAHLEQPGADGTCGDGAGADVECPDHAGRCEGDRSRVGRQQVADERIELLGDQPEHHRDQHQRHQQLVTAVSHHVAHGQGHPGRDGQGERGPHAPPERRLQREPQRRAVDPLHDPGHVAAGVDVAQVGEVVGETLVEADEALERVGLEHPEGEAGGDQHDDAGDDCLGGAGQIGATRWGRVGHDPADAVSEFAPGSRTRGDGERRGRHDERGDGDEFRRSGQPQQDPDRCGDAGRELPVGEAERHQHGGRHEERHPGLGAVEVRVLDGQHAERRQRCADEPDPAVPQTPPEEVDEGDGGGVDQRREQPSDEVGVVAGVEGVDPCGLAGGIRAVGAQLDAQRVGGGDDRTCRERAVGQERRRRLGGEQRRGAVHPGAAVGVGVELGADAVEVAGEARPCDVIGDDAPVALVGMLVGALVPVEVPGAEHERDEQERPEQDAARRRRMSSEQPHGVHRNWIGRRGVFVQGSSPTSLLLRAGRRGGSPDDLTPVVGLSGRRAWR
jgi:hypothetical protein